MQRISCRNWLYSLKHIAINKNTDWVLKNSELYISPKLVDHWWDLGLCYVVSNSSWLWWEFLKCLPELLWLWIKETLWWNIWGNQILSWSRVRNIRYLSIYCSCWNNLNSIYENLIIYEIFDLEVLISFSKCN